MLPAIYTDSMDHVAETALRASDQTTPRPSLALQPTFAEVYAAHFRFVWRTMRRLGVRDFEVDDAVQDVFLVVHRRLTDFRPDVPVKHWVFRIVSRVARDHRRSEQRKDPRRHSLQPVSDLDNVADVRQDGPLESAERAAAAQLIQDALSELDDAKREVFVLADLEEMTAPEIAQILDVPLNTVYSRLRVARREFEAALMRRQSDERSPS